MATKVEFHRWDGCEGFNDTVFLLGYCVEKPVDVLRHVYKEYNVYHYKRIYMPIDNRFPNNVSGLMISEAENLNISGCTVKITGSIKDLDLSKAYNEETVRTKETFEDALERCKRFYLFGGVKRHQAIYEKRENVINEIESVIMGGEE